jgi:predicted regulator of Ras-like GTPase activity (Roadblock/LC7/MglB family)
MAHRQAVAALPTEVMPLESVGEVLPRVRSHVAPDRPDEGVQLSAVVPQIPVAAAGPRDLFADLEASGGTSVLLVDRDGLTLAGRVRDGSGADASDVLGAELSGLSDEAAVALSQLGLGAWDRVVVECQAATIAFAPARDGAVVMLAAPSSTPLGLARMLLDRARRRADGWLEAL